MTSASCWIRRALVLLTGLTFPLSSQPAANAALQVAPIERAVASRNTQTSTKIVVQLRGGYHVNSDKPKDEFLIPLKLTWGVGPLQVEQVQYPAPENVRLAFSEQPVPVFSGKFEILTKFRAKADAHAGVTSQTGKLRYQACNDKECLPPKTLELQLPVEIK